MLQHPISALRRATPAARSLSSFPSYILNAPATEITTLSSGLRVASEGGHGDTATVGVWIDAGSRYETTKNNGVAHFLEHITFKGTNKRTRAYLEEEIENMGGHLNAYTSREQTVYYAKVFKSDIERALEILSDILLHSKMEKRSIDEERGVILREMDEVNNIMEEVIHDKLHETAFQTCGLGMTILGPVENINSLQRSDLVEYIETHYTAPRMVVAGAGAVNHEQLCELADKYFGNLPVTPRSGLVVPKDKGVFTGSDIRVLNDTMPVANVAVSFEGASWSESGNIPLMMLQTILGTWDRQSVVPLTPLCAPIAEKGLAHRINSFNTCYNDTGLFGVHISAEPQHLRETCEHVMDGLRKAVDTLDEAQVHHIRMQLKARWLGELDGSSQKCEDIGRQILTFGRRLTPAEVFARIDAVNVDTIKKTFRKVVANRDIAIAAVGPIGDLPSHDWFKKNAII